MGCFHFLTVTKNAVVNISVQLIFLNKQVLSTSYIPGWVRFGGLPRCLRECTVIFNSEVNASGRVHTSCYRNKEDGATGSGQ